LKSYYEILGVAETATEVEIKTAFRKLARENHPDTHPGDKAAEERFKQVAEAYEILGDPAKRKQYDLERKQTIHGRNARKGNVSTNPFDFHNMNFDDVFMDITREQESTKQETKKGTKSPINTDDLFSKFMGFRPKGE